MHRLLSSLCLRIRFFIMKELIDKLALTQSLSRTEYIDLLTHRDDEIAEYLFAKARETTNQYFNCQIYLRGLIELSSYCRCDCYYCGIRCSNKNAKRYRLSPSEILDCCNLGYKSGFRTFVLQGGEDRYFSDNLLTKIVSDIKSSYPDCAITLSLGEKSYASYLKFFKSGADRYLLRHETADPIHFEKLHPAKQTLDNRKSCLYALKDIGYQVGTGFMVGSPYQTLEHLANDLIFIQEFRPHMAGIGPFIPHKDTAFANKPAGSIELTLYLIAILRLMIPNLLIPSTTALGSIDPSGRELGIMVGANVIMPNLSPIEVRKKYSLYNNKISTGQETAEGISALQNSIESLGYKISVSRGDYRPLIRHEERSS